jgi:predicted membrane channel-forming protein YqfA (hemolysin III family)
MKGDFLDWEKGLKRLTLALFILTGTCVVIYLVTTNETVAIIVFFIVFIFLDAIGYYASRIFYGVIRWLSKRFSADKPKDEKDNKLTETPSGNR